LYVRRLNRDTNPDCEGNEGDLYAVLAAIAALAFGIERISQALLT